TGIGPGTTTITATSGSINGSTTLTVAGVPPLDLIMTNIAPNASTANQGGALSVSDTVSNSGVVSSGVFRIAYHLSTDPVYGNGDDIVISTIRVVTSLGAGASNTATTSLAIPSNAPGGTYYLCAKADSLNQVNEGGNEGNNTLCSVATVTLPKADLVVSALSATPTTVKAGRTITVSNSIKNQGGTKAGLSVVAFHLSGDTAYGGGDDIASTTTRTIASLAINATSAASTVVRVPAATPPGIYYVCIQADKNNTVAESDETNNTRCTATTITVTP
ncbi:MAG TPA: CARDB domain-containing protein, partial [Nitrospiria bacterium]|nr:CARDB domain-containing protein [Nitrospiria bacterium]